MRWNDESWLLSEIVELFDQQCLFQDVREALFQGKPARQEAADNALPYLDTC